MTKEEIKEKRKEIKYGGGLYYPVWKNPTLQEINEFIRFSLLKIEDSKLLEIHCSKTNKVLLLEKFYADDFNYLGTRFNIICDENMEFDDNEISVITGVKKFKLLVISDGKPLSFMETTQ